MYVRVYVCVLRKQEKAVFGRRLNKTHSGSQVSQYTFHADCGACMVRSNMSHTVDRLHCMYGQVKHLSHLAD